MRKRYITIPEKVAFINPEDSEDGPVIDNGNPRTITFPDFVRSRAIDPIFGMDIESVESALNIRMGVKGKAPAEVWEIDEDDWNRLCVAVKNPKTPYNPEWAISIIPFAKAILEAKTAR